MALNNFRSVLIAYLATSIVASPFQLVDSPLPSGVSPRSLGALANSSGVSVLQPRALSSGTPALYPRGPPFPSGVSVLQPRALSSGVSPLSSRASVLQTGLNRTLVTRNVICRTPQGQTVDCPAGISGQGNQAQDQTAEDQTAQGQGVTCLNTQGQTIACPAQGQGQVCRDQQRQVVDCPGSQGSGVQDQGAQDQQAQTTTTPVANTLTTATPVANTLTTTTPAVNTLTTTTPVANTQTTTTPVANTQTTTTSKTQADLPANTVKPVQQGSALQECPGDASPNWKKGDPIIACLLKDNVCEGFDAQQKSLAAMNPDPRFFGIASLENSHGNCGKYTQPGLVYDTVQTPKADTKKGEGDSALCGAFNNNWKAIQDACPGMTCDQLDTNLADAVKCQQAQIDHFGGFTQFAQRTRCGQVCSDTKMDGQKCGDDRNAISCTEAGKQYEDAVNHVTQVALQSKGRNMTGGIYLSPI